MLSLIKMANRWRVSYIEKINDKDNQHTIVSFDSIEDASELMMSLGIQDESIDDAVIAIYTYPIKDKLIIALFTQDGLFSHLDISS